MKKLALVLALTLPLQSCTYIYPVLAKVIGGRLAFVSGDDDYDCIASISVSAAGPRKFDPAVDNLQDPMAKGEAITRVRTAWKADAGQWVCKVHYPVFYGAEMPEVPTLAGPAKLRIDEPYSVSVMGHGSSGSGCFRIRRTGLAENLPDSECSIVENEPESPAVTAQGTVYPVRPHAAPASYFRREDAPRGALPSKGEATVRFVLDVNTEGKATACTVEQSSGSPVLDSTTCKVMRERATFIRASAPNGFPMASRIEQDVTWTPAGAKRPSTPPHDNVRAELDVWTESTNTLRTVGRFESMAACRAELSRRAANEPIQGEEAFCFEEPRMSTQRVGS